MNDKIQLTKEGKQKLQQELTDLIDNRRPEIIKQLKEAREQGDLSENADYDAAKQKQAEIEARIGEIKKQLDNVEIISTVSTKHVSIGNLVTIENLSTKKTHKYEIVGQVESNPYANKISNISPLAKAIIGKEVGEIAEVRDIADPYRIKIINIE
ncbi:MAG: transcription elongation factor GreA [Mycoplasmataceae bacterium]|jgi:transcription elongation factor GreA|nr:transcription elongation factor GreA [Mycoplasmataceae bacterium]